MQGIVLSTVYALSHLMTEAALKGGFILLMLLIEDPASKRLHNLPWVAKIFQIFLYVTLITAHLFF